jgi:hypothetical protein
MKTLLSIALFTTILHADAVPEMTSQQAPSQEMPDASQPAPNASQESPSSTQDIPQSYPEMADSVPAMEDTSSQAPVVEEVEMICRPLYGNFILNEFKMGYFRFGDRILRHMYDKGVLDLQLSSSFRAWKPLYVYAAAEYIGADGRTIARRRKTQVRLVPLSLGIQYIQLITFDLKYYLTLGPRLFYFHQKNHSNGSSINKWGCGGFINTGFMYHISENIIIDFFGEYSYKRMHFKNGRTNFGGNSLQVGGMTLGAGLGYFW